MDQTVLVDIDIRKGAEILAALDDTGIKVSVALWANLAEYEAWRMVLSGKTFDELDLRSAYRLLNESLSTIGIDAANSPEIIIM